MRVNQTLRLILRLLRAVIILAAFASLLVAALSFAMFALGAYRSSGVITSDDVRPLVRSIGEVSRLLDEGAQDDKTEAGDGAAGASPRLAEANAKVASALAGVQGRQGLNEQSKAELASALNDVAASIASAQSGIGIEQVKRRAAVAELRTRADELERKLGSSVPLSQVSAVWIKEFLIEYKWPILILVLLLVFSVSTRGPSKIADYLRPFKSLKLFEAEFVLSGSEETKSKTENIFDELRSRAKLQYTLWLQKRNFTTKFNEAAEELLQEFSTRSGQPLGNYRCTLHVPDIILADTLYQLVDYYPTKTGRDRIYSVGFGIVGRAWRLRKVDILPSLPRKPDGSLDEDKLIQQWGMTRDEVKSRGDAKKSFLCVPLVHSREGILGVIYVDSTEPDAFIAGAPADPTDVQKEDIRGLVYRICLRRGIFKELARIGDALGGSAPLIRVYER